MHTIATAPSHVTIDENGIARIDGTRMKVIHVAKEKVGRAQTAEQIQEGFPHLTMAQIHAALAYYYDHQVEMDAQIKRDITEADAMRAAAYETPLQKKLRDVGQMP